MTGQQVDNTTQSTERKKKKVQDNIGQLVETTSPFDNPYEFNKEEEKDYQGYNLDTPFARAWSRALRRGFRIGKPIDEEFDVPASTKKRQDYQFAVAYLETENNPNFTVSFHDGRGEMVRDSGI